MPNQFFPYRPIAQLTGSNGPVHALTYSAPPSTYILAGSSDRSIRLYNPSNTTSAPAPSSSNSITSPSSPSSPPLPTASPIQTYSSHGYEVLSLSVSSTNSTFLSAGGDRNLFLWDVATAQTVRRLGGLNGHSGRINSVVFAGVDDSLAISGGIDTTVRMWDLKSQSHKPVMVLEEAKDAITSVVVTEQGAGEIISGSVDGRVRGYDARMGRVVTDVVGASVTSLAEGRDGKTVLVGGLDSKIRLMDRRDGRCLKSYAGGGGGEWGEWRNEELRVQSVMGGGERWVVAGDEVGGEGGQGRVWVWDLMEGEVVARLEVPWGGEGRGRRVIGKDGREKERRNVVSCVDWKEGGSGNQFCVGGTSGVVTVFGQ